MFGWEFPPHNSGGLGTACFGLTRALSRDSDVVFVLPKKSAVDDKYVKMVFANQNSIDLKYVDTILKAYVTEQQYFDERYTHTDEVYGLSLMEEVKRYARKAGTIARKAKCDVIHAHDWLAYLAGMEAKKATGKPLIVHVHATEFDRTGGTGVNQQVYDIERAGMHAADAVIAVSQWTKNIVVNHYGVSPDKITVVHNGIDVGDVKPVPSRVQALKDAGNKIVLFVGRITMQKGPDYFIRAAKRVLEFRPNTIFLVSGSGDMERQMIRQAAAEGISDKVFFVGFLRGEELDSIYQSADLYVMPSISEPFGITPLEALANGTPVLISRQSGVAEVLNHALKTDFWDIDDTADKIISTLDHPCLHESLKVNGGREVAKNTWAVAAGKCLDVYGRLVVGTA